jgi:EAL domain-containing protein (putative c-di-GMP-specific phosphodiesterase class I)/GGDEF domain-containing protein
MLNSNIASSETSASSTIVEQADIQYDDFSIALSPQQLMQFVQQYDLKISNIAGEYVIHQEMLGAIQKIDTNSPEGVIAFIAQWPKQLNWGKFYEQIIALLTTWINDYTQGATLDTALLLLKSIQLNTSAQHEPRHESLKLELLLSHLIARVTNQFDQYKFEYWQHFNRQTQLPNEQLLLVMLQQLLAETTPSDPNETIETQQLLQHDYAKQLGIVLINLNIDFDEAFKLNTASSTLVDAAIQVLQQQLNHHAILFHTGPYEFVVLVKNLSYATQLNLIVSKFIYGFETPLPIENTTLILSPYFGAASTFNLETNAVLLFEHAKLALHHAMVKNEQMQIYEKDLSANFVNAHILDEAIIEALQSNELATFLQPIVSLENEQCATAEVLLRWPTTKWPFVSPARLIDTIYKKGFGKVFIRWLINNTCQRCAELLFQHHRAVLLTINVSVHDLLDPDLPKLIEQSIALWEIPAKYLLFEITESDLLSDESKVSQVIDEIKLLGCQIALDDFGTGYSSMARLRNMPVDFVKIDQSFVRNISNSPEDYEIVKTVTQLAHSLNKQVVCEGVEDATTAKMIKALGCEKIQGYFYSKPLSFEAFIEWLTIFEKRQAQDK